MKDLNPRQTTGRKDRSTRAVYTTGQVADLCGVNFRTVIRWVEKGYLNAYALPGRGDRRIEEEELLSFMRQHNMSPQKDSPRLKSGDSHYSILVVENEVPVVNSIIRALRTKNYQISTAHNGFEAGIKAKTVWPQLITMDLKMPGLSGTEVIRTFRQDKDLAGVKILVLSGAERSEIKKALAAGADDFLEKPFDKKQLKHKIEKLLGVKQTLHNP